MWENLDIVGWSARAGWALANFYSPESQCFRTGSRPSETSDGEPRTGAMSSSRSFIAALEFLHRSGEEGRNRGAERRLRTAVEGMCRGHYTKSLDYLRSHSGSSPNPFTDSHLVQALAASRSPFCEDLLGRSDPTIATRQEHLQNLSLELVEHLCENSGAKMPWDTQNSELVSLHAVRALDATARFEDTKTPGVRHSKRSRDVLRAHRARELRRWRRDAPKPDAGGQEQLDVLQTLLRNQARSSVVQQLGLHSASDAEFDAGSLLASTCILQRYGGRSGRHLIERAISIMDDSQADDGTWRAELVASSDSTLVYVSSIEMAIHVANLVLADLSHAETGLVEIGSRILERSFGLVESGYRDLRVAGSSESEQVAQGWANDRTRARREVESWTTALAVQLLGRMDEIQRQAAQNEVLVRYGSSSLGGEQSRWPDSAGVLGSVDHAADAVQHRVANIFSKVSDPSDDRQIVTGISEDIVAPILESPFRRPQSCSSFLLYGPPGTRKTSLVRAVAECLGWPLMTISPAHLLVDGIDGVEARAEAIFYDLLTVRRVVVLFDECEEFFRRRLPVGSPESRTQGAFITAGMLPRLQDLRDACWTVFVIVTNTELDELDPAIVRRGRLDKKQRMGHPTLNSQVQYLSEGIRRRRRSIDAENSDLTRAEKTGIRNALKAYEEGELEEKLTVFRSKRKDAVQKRQDNGDIRGYFDEVSKISIMEAELPIVTFAALDVAASELAELDGLDSDLIRDSVSRSAGADDSVGWAEVP